MFNVFVFSYSRKLTNCSIFKYTVYTLKFTKLDHGIEMKNLKW